MSGSVALYDADFFEWTKHQANVLREAGSRLGNVTDLDIEHLAEEIEDMGKRDLREAESRVLRILEHLLKLEYSSAQEPRAGWAKTIIEQRFQLELVLRDSPSLRRRIDVDRVYRRARELAVDSLAADGIEPSILPDSCPYSLDEIERADEEIPPD